MVAIHASVTAGLPHVRGSHSAVSMFRVFTLPLWMSILKRTVTVACALRVVMQSRWQYSSGDQSAKLCVLRSECLFVVLWARVHGYLAQSCTHGGGLPSSIWIPILRTVILVSGSLCCVLLLFNKVDEYCSVLVYNGLTCNVVSSPCDVVRQCFKRRCR